jgi:hypothetical protein
VRERIQRAHALGLAGSLDEAASLLDGALEDAERAPGRTVGGPELVDAYIQRAVIALARGEQERLERVLAQLLRDDPAIELTAAEASPQLRDALAAARQRAGETPVLAAGDVADACEHLADVVVIGRAVEPDRVQLVRYDACQRVADVTIAATTPVDAHAVATLSGPRARLSASVHAEENARELATGPVRRLSPRQHEERVFGVASLATGVALAIPATYFAVHAASLRSHLNDNCAPCEASVLQQRGDAIHRADLETGVLFSVAGAAVITGVVLAYLGFREESVAPRVTVSSSGPGLGVFGAF